MADITKSVGEGGFNLGHDVAMVQAMLGLVKNAKGHVYLPAHYDGSYGVQTRTALIAFQTDHGLVPAPYPAHRRRHPVPIRKRSAGRSRAVRPSRS